MDGVGVGAGVGEIWPTLTQVQVAGYIMPIGNRYLWKNDITFAQNIGIEVATEEKERSNTYVSKVRTL